MRLETLRDERGVWGQAQQKRNVLREQQAKAHQQRCKALLEEHRTARAGEAARLADAEAQAAAVHAEQVELRTPAPTVVFG